MNTRTKANMKRIATLMMVAGLSIGSATASITDPGAAHNTPSPNPYPIVFPDGPTGDAYLQVTLLDDSLNQAPSETFTTALGFTVTEGDLVLLESNNGDHSKANWSDVLHFYNQGILPGTLNTPAGFVTLYSWDDWSSFSSAVEHTFDGTPSPTLYIPEAVVPGSEDPGYAGGNFTTYIPDAGQTLVLYRIESVVPEPSTCVAGALLLLPFGMSTLRILRKKRAV